MYKAVIEVCNQYETIWNQTPEFSKVYGSFGIRLLDLSSQTLGNDPDIGNSTKENKDLLEKLINQGHRISRALQKLAIEVRNTELLTRNTTSKTDLESDSPLLRLARMRRLIADATEHLTSLKDHGIGQGDLIEFSVLIDDYANTIGKPRLATLERQHTSIVVQQLVSTIDSILKNQLDTIMEVFKSKSPDFYAKYFGARIILDIKGKHRASD